MRTVATVVFFATLWFVLCRHLSGEWSVNEQYNYGWFVPFFALILYWLRWEDRPRPNPEIRNSKSEITAAAFAIVPLLLLLPLRLFQIGNPDWRPLAWLHATVAVTLTLLYIWYVGGASWLRHFAFPVAFIFVAVPWVTPIEAPVIQDLMHGVAATVSETVNLFGVPAQLEGNLIRVGSGLVGMNEACSGVRSLQTSLMIGLLLGEMKRLSVWRRTALVLGAIAIAILANFFRAAFLVWIAGTRSLSAAQRWHDMAGYAIVGLVFVGSLLLAGLLGRENLKAETGSKTSKTFNSSFVICRSSFFAVALLWLVFVEFAAANWYRAHESNLVASTRWSVRWPERVPSFRVLKLDEQVRGTLRFDEGKAASWNYAAENSAISSSAVETSPRVTCFVYFFRWKPGGNSALLANLHRPDVCLPAIGWKQVADDGVREYAAVASLRLPFRHFEFQHGTKNDPAPQVAHAFYCLWEDRAPCTTTSQSQMRPGMTGFPSSWTREERVRTVFEGRRHLGQQVMEVVLLTHGLIDTSEAQAGLAALLPKLIVLTPISNQ